MNQRIALAQPLALPSTGAANQPDNFGLQIAGTCTAAPRYGAMTTDANKHHGTDSPELDKVQQPHPTLESGFFTSTCCVWHAQLSFLVGCVGAPAKVRRFLIPVCQPRTVCHPRLTAMAAGLTPVDKEPILANTIPKGHIAPASLPTTGKQSHTFDPVAAHGQAVNALAMAKFYANRHNHAGAARKCVQALSALRQLAAFERVEANHAV